LPACGRLSKQEPCRDHQDHRVRQDQLAHPARRENLDCRDRQVKLARRVLTERLANRVRPDHRVRQDRWVPRANRENAVMQDQPDLSDPQDHRDLLAHTAGT
jgi:hypothetical protein